MADNDDEKAQTEAKELALKVAEKLAEDKGQGEGPAKVSEHVGPGTAEDSQMTEVDSEVWQSIASDSNGSLGEVFPEIDHEGGSHTVKTQLHTAASVPDVTKNWSHMLLVTYQIDDKEVYKALQYTADPRITVNPGKQSGISELSGNRSQMYDHLIAIKMTMKKLIEYVSGFLGQEKNLLTSDTGLEGLYAALIYDLVEMNQKAGDWKSVKRRLKYFYKVLGSSKTGNVIPHKSVRIELNKMSALMMDRYTVQPGFNRNSSLVNKTLFLVILVTGLGLPWGYYGYQDWLDMRDSYDKWTVKTEGTPGATRMQGLTKMLNIIASAENTVLIQPDVSNREIAEVIAYRILQCATFETMETAKWEDGQNEKLSGLPWETKYFRIAADYVVSFDVGANISLEKKLAPIVERIGFPVTGSRTWNAYIEWGTEIDCIKACAYMEDELILTTLELGVANVFTAPEPKYLKLEGTSVVYESIGKVSVVRDGTMIIEPWDTSSVSYITSVDRWFAVLFRSKYRKGVFAKIVIKNDRKDWSELLRSLAIKKGYIGIGLTPAVGGRSLPYLGSAAKGQSQVIRLPCIPDFASKYELSKAEAKAEPQQEKTSTPSPPPQPRKLEVPPPKAAPAPNFDEVLKEKYSVDPSSFPDEQKKLLEELFSSDKKKFEKEIKKVKDG